MLALKLSFIASISWGTSHLFAQHEFTGSAGDQSWENSQNWKLGILDPAPNFPDDNASAIISTGLGSVKLSKNILLNSLNLQGTQTFTIDLDGNSLSVGGTLTESGATHVIKNGTLTAPRLRIDDLIVEDVTLTPNDTIISGAGITLNGTSQLINTGSFVINSSGGVSGNSLGGITNRGQFEKMGPGFATISKPYLQENGDTILRAGGELIFSNSATFQGGFINAEGFLSFNDPTSLSQTSILVGESGAVLFQDTLNVTGELSIVGGAEQRLVVAAGALGGGTFNTLGEPAFVFNGSEQAQMTQVTNKGKMIHSGGTFRNVINESSGRFSVENLGLTPKPRLLDGTLVNRGQFTLKSNLNLADQAEFTNEGGGVMKLDGGIISPENASANPTLSNAGTLTLDAPADELLPVASLTVDLNSTGAIEIDRGRLSLLNETVLSGTVKIKQGLTGETNQLSLGAFDTPDYFLANVMFDFPAGPGASSLLFERGRYTVTGKVESSGSEAGVITTRSTWDATSGGELSFDSNSPLTFGASVFSSTLNLSSPLTNSGSIIFRNTFLKGSQPLVNEGELEVSNIVRMGAANDSSTGFFENDGLVTMNNGIIRMTPGSQIHNRANSTATPSSAMKGFQLNGTSRLDTEGSFSGGGSDPVFNNEGLFRVSGSSGKIIDVVFEQKGGSNSVLEVDSSSDGVTFRKPVRMKGGKIIAGRRVNFTSDTEWGEDTDVTIEPPLSAFNVPELVRFSNSEATFRLHSNIVSRGRGDDMAVALEAGTMTSMGGELNCGVFSYFSHQGGTLGGSGSPIVNNENYYQTGGELAGEYINKGDHESDNGLISAAASNRGEMQINGTIITGNLTNEAGDLLGEGEGSLRLLNGELQQSGAIEAEAPVELRGTFRCKDSSSFNLDGTTLTLIGSASLRGIDNSSFRATGLGTEIISRPPGSASTGSSVLQSPNLTLTDVSIDTREYGLLLQGTAYSVSGTEVQVGEQQTFQLRGEPQTGIPQFNSLKIAKDGRAEFIDNGSQTNEVSSARVETQGTLRGNLRQTGLLTTGENFGRDIIIDGGLIQEASAVTMFNGGILNGLESTKLRVFGDAQLNGTLKTVVNGLAPGESFELIRANSITGTFSNVQIDTNVTGTELVLSYTSNSVVVTAQATAGESYDDWLDGHFTANEQLDPNISGQTVDFDHDGADNWREFLGGTNPIVNDAQDLEPLIRGLVIDGPDLEGNYHLRVDTSVRPGLAGVSTTLHALGELSLSEDDTVEASYLTFLPTNPGGISIQCAETVNLADNPKEFLQVTFSRGF